MSSLYRASRRAANKRYREKNRELINAKARADYQLGKKKKYPRSQETTRNLHYQRKYGISLDEYKNLAAQQNNKCCICGEEETTKSKTGEQPSLCVDHCHDTGKVRGLLCRMCNSALGKFKDSVEILEKAKLYLTNHGRTKNK